MVDVERVKRGGRRIQRGKARKKEQIGAPSKTWGRGEVVRDRRESRCQRVGKKESRGDLGGRQMSDGEVGRSARERNSNRWKEEGRGSEKQEPEQGEWG